MEIVIVKEKTVVEYNGWYNKIVKTTPVFWVGPDGVKHFMTNLQEETGSDFDDARSKWDLAHKEQILRQNGGRYIPVHLNNPLIHYPVEDLEAFMEWKKNNGYTFNKDMTDPLRWDDGEKCFNFLGNLNEYSAAFWFKIYDRDLADRCIKALAEEGIRNNDSKHE